LKKILGSVNCGMWVPKQYDAYIHEIGELFFACLYNMQRTSKKDWRSLNLFRRRIIIMAKYVFFNVPVHGHVNPTLPIVQELVRRGQQVSYYLTEEFRDAVQATGAVFHGYESKMKEVMGMSFGKEGNTSPERVASISQEIAGQMRQVPPGVMDSVYAEQPDVIVYDVACMWAKKVIQELQIPAITTCATYTSNEHFNIHEEDETDDGRTEQAVGRPICGFLQGVAEYGAT
jgi:MGT family glycosyltransferase